jgi:hypothetical protein
MDLFENKKRDFFLSNFILEKMSENIQRNQKKRKKSFLFIYTFFSLSSVNISKNKKFFLFF